MIRNIPNKYSQNLMLTDIDQKFENAYDFFYLPIDSEVISMLTSEQMQCRLCFHQPFGLKICERFLLGVPRQKVEEIQ